MEETVGTCSDGLVTIDATRTNDADGCCQLTILGMHVFHHTGLNARSMRTEQNVLGDIIGML